MSDAIFFLLPHNELRVEDRMTVRSEFVEAANMPDEQWPQIVAGKPACYRIVVQGGLDEEKWSGRLGGMQIARASV